MTSIARRFSILVLAALLTAGSGRAAAQERAALPPYRDQARIVATSPGTEDGVASAVTNPAQWGAAQTPGFAFWWTDENVRPNALDSWGIAAGEGLGFTAGRRDIALPEGRTHVMDYQIGAGGGNGQHFGGASIGWASGDTETIGRKTYLALGSIQRPSRSVSIGLLGRLSLEDDAGDAAVDIGVRPLGDPRVVLFGDYVLARGERWDDGSPGGGIAVRPIPGLSTSAKWEEAGGFQFGVGIAVGHDLFSVIPRRGMSDQDLTSFVFHAGAPIEGYDLDAKVARGRRVLEMPLKGRVAYQKRRFGDEKTLTLRDLTGSIRLATKDPTVAGVAINLSGLSANIESIWEIREELVALRAAGKTLVVYADQIDIAAYYLASVADRLVVDPMGVMLSPGLQISKTYQRDMLAKLGIGFEEWRYFRYKSALEIFSRTSMSEADREQLQDLVGQFYDEIAEGIASTGRVSRTEWDRIVNEEPGLLAKRMVELGLADTLGRWEQVQAIADSAVGRKTSFLSATRLQSTRRRAREEWGRPPTIALVYAVGPCAMDAGIAGRATSKAMQRFRKDRGIDALVLRADSPGGDPLPSDLVANELLELRKAKKPTIASQGRVAASGGYWISMDADSIVASPFTITGSIGVIGGWIWNAGMGDKLGLVSDRVQEGRSADLMGGLRLPLLGARIPERNLDEREQALVEKLIHEMYDTFTSRVATGRRLDVGEVRRIAEGHVYSGRRGVELSLVDRIGTLDSAIESAKRAAGIAPGREVRIVEYPEPGLIRWPDLFKPPSLFARGAEEREEGRTYEEETLGAILDAPGRPLLLTPGTFLPDEEAPR